MEGSDPEKKGSSVDAHGVDTEAGTITVPAGKVDAALEFLQTENTALMSELDEKNLVRKIDFMIMPLMWLCYNLQYLDKVLINYASVMGLLSDTNMRTDQFSNLALAFYITYLFFEFPTGYLMQRLPTAKYLGVNEQPRRMGYWYLGTGTATIMGALVAYGLLFYTGDKFRSWQIMFLIFGLVTITVGICVFIFLPDNPMTSRLSHDEKIWAIERLRENKTGIENKHFKRDQFLEVWKDPQTYLIIVIVAASNIPNAAISSFSSLIIKGFGFTTKQTELLSIPSGAVSVIGILTGTYLSGRFNQRCLCAIGILLCGLLGGCLMAFSRDDMRAAKLAGNYLTNFVGASLPIMYSIAGANTAGHTKKVTMNAVVLMAFCLGNILGPLTFRTQDEPDYIPAKIAIVATVAVAIVFLVLLKLYYMWENKRRDKNKIGLEHQENSEFLDLTDKQNKEFRYKH
ncbi:hypothetical protein Plec18167_001513 [Paecilomyces lecythidis]|uniref:Allantoate permease n=1 Tax=Paecilomyces lecythidis TaxID=3004212 RepID=A0ABR3Y972_9EURO